MGFFSVYICRCASDNSTVSTLTATVAGSTHGGGRGAGRGIDLAVLETFPTMKYTMVKKFKGGKVDTLEYVVCLSEFLDDDTLRLLPKCYHAFHHDYIEAAEAVATDAAGDGGDTVSPDHMAIDVDGEEQELGG